MECSLYKINVPDKFYRKRTLYFYAWCSGGCQRALVLGCAAHDIPCSKEPESVYDERKRLEAANRTMQLKDTLIKDSKGRYFCQRWECQAVLVALWRKLQGLGFLQLPKRNPFMGKRPKHEDLIDYEDRYRFFRKCEHDLKKKDSR